MEEKFYTIGTHTSRQYNEIRRELISEGNNRSSVPSRIVTNSDEIKHSGIRGEFLLTDEEADTLRNDSQIRYVMLSIAHYPELYPVKTEDVIESPTNNTLQNRYSTPTKHYQDLFSTSGDVTPDSNRVDFGTIAEDLNHATSQLIRCGTASRNPWITLSEEELQPNQNYVPNVDDISIISHHQQKGAGEDVDVIVADDGCWFGHVEFTNSGVTNAENPIDYIGGNMFSSDGSCGLLDVVLDEVRTVLNLNALALNIVVVNS